MDVYKVNICLIGDSFSGKSTFFYYLINNYFKNVYEKTIGVEFATRTFKVNDLKLIWQIWDIAGSKNYITITNSYFKDISLYFLFFDLSNKETFKNIKTWMERINYSKNSNFKVILIGNKYDLNIKIDSSEISRFKSQYNLDYYEISIKRMNNKLINDVNKYFSNKIKNNDSTLINHNIKKVQTSYDNQNDDYYCFGYFCQIL